MVPISSFSVAPRKRGPRAANAVPARPGCPLSRACGYHPLESDHRPTSAASYPVSVRRVATLLHASFRQSLAVLPLRFASASPPSGCTGDFHPQDCRTCPTHRLALRATAPRAAAVLTRHARRALGSSDGRRGVPASVIEPQVFEALAVVDTVDLGH